MKLLPIGVVFFFLLSFFLVNNTPASAIGDPTGLSIIQKKLPRVRLKGTPTPTPILACLEVITYAKNPKNGNCKSFSSSCEVPKNWKVVDECPTKPTNK